MIIRFALPWLLVLAACGTSGGHVTAFADAMGGSTAMEDSSSNGSGGTTCVSSASCLPGQICCYTPPAPGFGSTVVSCLPPPCPAPQRQLCQSSDECVEIGFVCDPLAGDVCSRPEDAGIAVEGGQGEAAAEAGQGEVAADAGPNEAAAHGASTGDGASGADASSSCPPGYTCQSVLGGTLACVKNGGTFPGQTCQSSNAECTDLPGAYCQAVGQGGACVKPCSSGLDSGV